MFSIPLIESAYPMAATLWPELDHVLSQLPSTVCRRKTACCALLPQMTLLEAGRIINRVKNMANSEQRPLVIRLVRYFHLNAARIMGCPFLSDQMCLVYQERPFGCRAYGLWSPKTYRQKTEAGLLAQKAFQQAWASMGVSLPREVVEYKPPYCRDVVLEGDGRVTDQDLLEIEMAVQELNRQQGAPARHFNRFHSDLAFLLTVSVWGMEISLKNKVNVVREYTETGRSPSLDDLLGKQGLRP